MQFMRTENDFTLRLTPVSVGDSESLFDVASFIDPNDIDEVSRATTGVSLRDGDA